jgi:hypothetical protein
MNEHETVDTKQPTGAQCPSGDHRAGDAGTEDLTKLREEKIVDYLREGLANKDPAIANASALNADLLFYAAEIRRMVAPAFKMTPAELAELANLFPVIDMGLRVHRLSERFSVFIERLKRQQEASDRSADKLSEAEVGQGTAAAPSASEA